MSKKKKTENIDDEDLSDIDLNDVAPELDEKTDETKNIKKGSSSIRNPNPELLEQQEFSEAYKKIMGEYLKYVAGTSVELVETVTKLGVDTYKIIKPLAEKEGKDIYTLFNDILQFYINYKDKVPQMEEELFKLNVENAYLKKKLEELGSKAYIDVNILDAITKIMLVSLLKDIDIDKVQKYIDYMISLLSKSKDVKVSDINIFNVIVASVMNAMENNKDIKDIDPYINYIISKYKEINKS